MVKQLMIFLCVCLCSAYLYAGTLSTSPWVANSDTGISHSKIYTHTVDFGAAHVNPSYDDVIFDSVGNSGGVIDGSDYNFSLTTSGAFGNVGNVANNLESGFSQEIVSDMIYPYNGVMTLTMAGLIPGCSYRLTLYSISWEDSSRISVIYGDDMKAPAIDDIAYQVNQDEYGTGNGILVFYDYVAQESGTLNLSIQSVTGNWHFYGFSNEYTGGIQGVGTLSASPWVTNADTGISNSRIYTHLIDFGDISDNPSYNGVTFNSVGNSGGVIDGSAHHFSLTTSGGFGSVANIDNNLESGFSHDIVSDMVYPYNGVVTLTLNGLVPGSTCRLTLYSIGWENGDRISMIYGDDIVPPASDDAAFQVNQDEYGQGNGLLVFYDYVAPASGELSVTFQIVAGGGWHFYGFSNESSESWTVAESVMSSIYEEIKTPYKYGIVLPQQNGQLVDSPSVFRYDDQWYMMYITHDGTGYTTELAQSDDLLHWDPLGTILGRQDQDVWDCNQVAGYIALQDTTWGGSCELELFEDKYWLSYIGGINPGYETAPLSIGVASTSDPSSAAEWQHRPQAVLTPSQPDARWWENYSLYKSNIIHDKDETLGWPYVMYYNAVFHDGYEQIGMAVSRDMVNWTRYGGDDPVVTHGGGITGDPQVVKIGNVWVMFYFGAGWCPGAVERFACSYDLVHWTKWDGADLIAPTEDWDAAYAHKPWVIKVDGVVYHYYCATGSQGRTIALATSDPLLVKEQTPEDLSRRVSTEDTLRWPPDLDAVSYDVYLGQDYESVLEATKFSPCDYDQSGLVDLNDFAFFAGSWLNANELLDRDENGSIGTSDLGFFIENWLSVSNPLYQRTTSQRYYDVDGLGVFGTYYWRIDENTSEGTIAGDVYTFTVSPDQGVLAGQSSLISSALLYDTFAVTSSRDDSHNFDWYLSNKASALEVDFSNSSTVSWSAGSPANVGFRSSNSSYSGFGNKGASTGVLNITDTQVSIPGNTGEQAVVVQFDAILPSVLSSDTSGRLEINCSSQPTAFTGQSGVFSVFLKKVGIFHEISFSQANYAEKKVLQNVNVSDNEWHNYAVVFDKSLKTVEIFVDEEPVFRENLNEFNNGVFASFVNDVSFGIGGTGKIVIDNVQVGPLGFKGVHHPQPANGTGCETDVELQWSASSPGCRYDIYLGDTYLDVLKATRTSAQYCGRQDVIGYPLSSLEAGKDFYWRIDEVFGDTVKKGRIWKFSTYDTFLTHDIAAPTRLYYLHYTTYNGLSDQEKRLFSMLQGTVSKTKPELYACLHNDHVAFLEDLEATYSIYLTDIDSVRGATRPLIYLLKKYRNRFDGYIVYDQSENPESILVATSLAGLYNYLPVDVSLLDDMYLAGIPEAMDVRDKNSKWLFTHYWDQFGHNAMMSANPAESYFSRLYDLSIASGIPMFWNKDPYFNAQLLDALLPNSIVYGWGNPSIGASWGDEANFVDLFSSNAACIAPTDSVQDLTVMAGMASYTPEITFTMPNRPSAYEPESGVHYVTFLMGDMDHVLDGLHYTGSDRAYGSAERGSLPMNWQTPAYMTRLAPSSLSWFYRNATSQDHFVDFFSGLYMHPHIHQDLERYCHELNNMALKADQHVTVLSEAVPSDAVERQQWTEKVGLKYADMSAFRGFFTYPILQGDGQIYWFGGKPFINHRFVLQDGDNGVEPAPFGLAPAELADAINALPANPSLQAGYSFVYIANWGHAAYANAMETAALLNPNVRVVSMEEFIERVYMNHPQ